MRFTVFQDSRKGARRVNQDRVAYVYSRDSLLMVLADGMGGHMGGEIAAQIAVRLFAERFQQEAKPLIASPFEFLHDTMRRVHVALGTYTRQFSMVESPRTTCVAVVVQAGYAYWAHVGDSRLYFFRDGELFAKTKDHSKIQYLIDRGVLSEENAVHHPERNRIYSCLGGLVEPVVDLSRRTPMRANDIILLCSDGFWAMVPPKEIIESFTITPLLEAAPGLLRIAQDRAGDESDNLSMIVMRWDTETPGPSTITETASLSAGEFQTEIATTISAADGPPPTPELTEGEIEFAIAEIQQAIKNFHRERPEDKPEE
ncbi:MAG: serine/threonine-protein phosphatase [Burkholderiales bacterium]|jgi:serine/threonine protein phosphatase PrpC|nr:serine/threonine-protein phosphatase [Burkholderiales bacterium]